MKYRKKPVVIEAVQWDGRNMRPIIEFVRLKALDLGQAIPDMTSFRIMPRLQGDKSCLEIDTLEGTMTASPGDYIIRGIKGEYYPCKPDIFAETYDEVEE